MHFLPIFFDYLQYLYDRKICHTFPHFDIPLGFGEKMAKPLSQLLKKYYYSINAPTMIITQ
jgi:hypothetical protein